LSGRAVQILQGVGEVFKRTFEVTFVI
jgi:hypothetical protein